MRDINKVINLIKKQVPKKWDMRTQFFDAVDVMMASTRWTAPEIRVIRFEKLSKVLEDYLQRPEEEWKQYVWKIFNGDIYQKGLEESTETGIGSVLKTD